MKELTRQDQGKVCEHCAYVGGMEHDRHRICRKNAPGNGKWAQTTNSGHCGEWFPSDYWMEHRKWFERGEDPRYKRSPMSPATVFSILEEEPDSKRKQEAVLRLVRRNTRLERRPFFSPHLSMHSCFQSGSFVDCLVAMGWLYEDEFDPGPVCLTREGEMRIHKLTDERLGLG